MRARRSRGIGALLAGVLIVALVAACGGDSGDDGGGSASTGGAATSGESAGGGDTWNVPIVSDLTGPFGVFGVPWSAGVKARFTEINDAGGIHGKKIDFGDVYDSQSSPDVAPGVYQRVLGSDPVMVAGYTISSALIAAENVLATSQGPLVSSSAISGWLWPEPKPWYYTAQTVGAEPMESVVVKAKELLGSLEGKKIDVVIWDIPALVEFADALKSLGGGEGFTVPQVVTTDSGQTPSWVAQAESIVEDDPDLVFVAVGEGDVPPLARALIDAGYEGPIFSALSGNLPQIFEAIDSEQYYSYREATLPVPGDELTRIAEAAGVAGDANSTWFSTGYAAATMIGAVLEKCGASCTAAQALETIQAIGEVEVPADALFGPLEASSTRHQMLTALRFYTWDADTKEVVPSGDPIPLGGSE